MDKLGQQLRNDAKQIEIEVSEQLQQRIDASLRASAPPPVAQQPVSVRGPAFWWASSLTGLLTASVLMIVINMNFEGQSRPTGDALQPPPSVAAIRPSVDWNVQPAMLTGPLEDELAALQADMEKVQQQVKDDIGL